MHGCNKGSMLSTAETQSSDGKTSSSLIGGQRNLDNEFLQTLRPCETRVMLMNMGGAYYGIKDCYSTANNHRMNAAAPRIVVTSKAPSTARFSKSNAALGDSHLLR